MKKYLPLVVTVLLTFAGAAFGQDATKPTPEPSPKPKPAMSKAQIQRTLIRSEKALWEGWKNKDVKPFKAWIAAEAIGIGEMGTQGKAALLKDIAAGGCDIKSFELSEFKLTMLDSDAVVLTYKGSADGTCAGNPIPTVWASSTWVRRGGRWLAMTHQETPTH
ncbi:MAG TPA: nuclear transport factor 2 family protein [Pyrinomonadaceae bacterium]|nr:nuclear transport factor 2 family protein [Pyrinomonadaceae bacterium]